jgi:ACS family hexuronate transporter-like MFS transporter
MMLTEQSISSEQYSWITSAFQLGVMCQPLIGYFLDGVRASRSDSPLCVDPYGR